MTRNEMADTGMAEDLLRSIVQMGCAEVHALTLYNKATAELDNGLIDVEDMEVVQRQIEKIEMFREDIETYANLRRRMTKALFDMFDNEKKDKNMWCQIKHLGIAMYTAFETYEASDNDPELLLIAYDTNKAFTKAVTRFLGVEISDCASCMSDSLKAEKGEDSDGTSNKEL